MAADRTARTDVLVAGLIVAFTAVPTHLRPFSFDTLLDVFGFDPLDVVENVLGYVPLGAVLRKGGQLRAVVLSGILSLLAETIQIFCVGRDPQIVDVATNVVGAGLGVWWAGKWGPLPERVSVTTTLAVTSAAIAIAYMLSGATITAETVVNQLAGWWETPPWTATNPRGSLSEGTLEAHWSFDRLDDDIIADASASQLNGTVINSPTLAPGLLGSSIVLSGKQWVDFGRPVALRLTGSMTLSAWVRPSAFPPDDAAIISSLAPRERGYQLDLTPDQGPRTIGFKVEDATGHLMARYGRTPMVVDRWYNVAGVYDAGARTLDVYLNGRRDNGCLLGMVTDRQGASGGRVLVGARPDEAGYEFIGAIDELKIESRALTRSEIRADAAAAGRTSEPEDDRAPTGAACFPVGDAPLRVAGPLVSLGILVALAFAGVSRRAVWLGCVSSASCLLIGATAALWMSSSVMLQPAWLPTLYVSLGAAVGLLACRTRSAPIERR